MIYAAFHAHYTVNAFCYKNLSPLTPHKLSPFTNSITYITPITYKAILTSFITYNFLILSYIILCTIFYNIEYIVKFYIWYYYNIVNTCNYIVTIMADMICNYLNKYNYIDLITKIKISITKIKINNRNGYLSNIYIE